MNPSKVSFPDLEKELEQLIKADDENMILFIQEDAWKLLSLTCVNVNLKDPERLNL